MWLNVQTLEKRMKGNKIKTNADVFKCWQKGMIENFNQNSDKGMLTHKIIWYLSVI